MSTGERPASALAAMLTKRSARSVQAHARCWRSWRAYLCSMLEL